MSSHKSCFHLALTVVLLVIGVLSLYTFLPLTAWHIPARSAQTSSTPTVIVNEIAWGGTAASVNHEWIELYNNTPNAVVLTGWRLYTDDGSPDISLNGTIAAYGYFLIERSVDEVISDISADMMASFGLGLSNDGEILYLSDSSGTIVDTVNPDGEAWVNTDYGATPFFQSLERKRPTLPGTNDNWLSNDGTHSANGLDADNNPISGTPKSINAATLQSPTQFVDLSVDITGPATVDASALVTYTLNVDYTGTLTATDILITVTYPSDLDFVSQNSACSYDLLDGQIVWSIGDIDANSPTPQVITATLLHNTTTSVTLTTTATIVSSVEDDTPEDNNDTAITEVILPGFNSETIKISALLYDGYQPLDIDEAIQLANTGETAAILRGWQLCKDDEDTTTCRILPDLFIAANADIWLTRDSDAFNRSFGYAADYQIPTLPNFPNTTSCALRLIDEASTSIDTVVYGNLNKIITGWTGESLESYSVLPQAIEGQILARRRDEFTYQPVPDTDTAADWMQYQDDLWYGRQFRYPGWDHKLLNQPLTTTTTANMKVGIAPDNAYELVDNLLNQAESSIDISMYTLTHPALIDLLAQKALQGVTVRVLLEGNPVASDSESPEWQTELYACSLLEQAGGECWFMIHDPQASIFNRYTYLHAKYAIIDNEWLVISTQNFEYDGLPSDPKENGTLGSRGYVIATDAEEVVQHAHAIFELDLDPTNHNDLLRWNTGYPERFGMYDPALIDLETPDHISHTIHFDAPLSITTEATLELFTAPEAALRTGDAFLGMIAKAGAGDSIYVEQAYEHATWGDYPNLRLQAYIEAARRGAKVRILLNGLGYTDEQSIPPEENVETLLYLNALDLDESLDLQAALGNPTMDGIHSKLVLVALSDGTRISHIGSINGSEASSKINREIALQVISPSVFDYLFSAFSMDWWSSMPVYLPFTVRDCDTNFNRVTHILISEVAYNQDASHEWVELYNPTSTALSLSGYHLGDASLASDFEGMFIFPDGATIEPHSTLVVAVDGATTYEADYEFYENSTNVPNMLVDPNWGDSAYPFALHNAGDEVLLLDINYKPVDVVVYGIGTYPNVIPHPGAQVLGASLERHPIDEDTHNCAEDFRERYPPTPGELP